jgi:RNA polymerase sigma-70 factor (ECF subfamily)
MSQDQDPDLVERARAGSREAFSLILDRHQAHVRAFLGRYVRNPDVVDDLAQETFLSAYRSLATYRAESPLRIWLLGIARHRALAHLRDEERRRAHEGGSLAAALAGWLAGRIESDPGSAANPEPEVSALRSCIEGLPRRSAGLVKDFYFKGHSAARIARETGTAEGTVWVTLLRIREVLRNCIRLRLRAGGAGA